MDDEPAEGYVESPAGHDMTATGQEYESGAGCHDTACQVSVWLKSAVDFDESALGCDESVVGGVRASAWCDESAAGNDESATCFKELV